MNKLPSEVRLLIGREISEEKWNVEVMMKIIDREVNAHERTAVSSNPTKKTHPKGTPSAAALMTNNSTEARCVYCDQEHPSSSCSTVTNIDSWREVLRKAGRCYICLRRHHISRDCRSTMRCSECKGRHHISICLRSTSRVRANPPTSTTMPEGARSGTRAPPESTNNMCVNTQAPVLLQTARMPVYNLSLKGSPVIQARAIFDSGSQRTYITSHLSKALSLHPSRTETLYVKTFGSTQGEERNCDVVDLGIITKEEGSLSLSALIVPVICSPLMSQPISYSKERYDHLQGLDLADAAEVEDALEADILIGSRLVLEIGHRKGITGEKWTSSPSL